MSSRSATLSFVLCYAIRVGVYVESSATINLEYSPENEFDPRCSSSSTFDSFEGIEYERSETICGNFLTWLEDLKNIEDIVLEPEFIHRILVEDLADGMTFTLVDSLGKEYTDLAAAAGSAERLIALVYAKHLYLEDNQERAEELLARLGAKTLAAFLVGAMCHGWISRFQLGVNDEGELS